MGNATLQEKWDLNDELKRSSTVDDIYGRMARGVERMLVQGVQALGTFIDVDEMIEDKAIRAAQKIRELYKDQLLIKFINQAHKGVLDPKAREWFDRGAEFVDIIGGLPEKDKGRETEHLDILLSTAKRMGKMAHVHIDQFNSPEQKDTELLAKKTIEHGMQGKVVGIHGLSLAAQPEDYRKQTYSLMREAGLMMVACPIAWIDSRRNDTLSPTHNSLTPVDELVPAGITVALGTDNIADIYKPFAGGDLWEDLHLMLEGCRFYDVDSLVDIAVNNGKKVLGIELNNPPVAGE
jgi:cytosine/adenosine deaminase-related metal-dependent hydrolase